MSEPVLIAIIAAGATIIAAIIGVFASEAKSKDKIIVKQIKKGKGNSIQVGVVKGGSDDTKCVKEGKKNERKR